MFCCLSHEPMPALNDRDLAFVSSFAELLANAIWSGLQADQERLHLRQQIEDLITDYDYQLLMKPIVSLQDNSVNGAKAPCRFRPFPYRSPDTWFADARTIFLQRELERAVLQKTLDLLKDLPRALKLPINVSLETFIQEDMPALIAGPSSDRIILKLTENDYLVSIAAIQTQIKQLNRLGAKIAVDDLSASYSSLSTVLQIKPDFVRLDSELVRGINLDSDS